MSDLDLPALGERWGTPLYVVSLDQLRTDVERVTAALSPAGTRLLFSLKTNYLPAVTRALCELGVGVDVVSGYELQAALDAGFPADRIVFNGPVKTAEELSEAVARGIYVNIDGVEEIDVLAQLAERRDDPLEVGVRVYPPEDVYADRAAGTRRAVPSKFGWPIATGEADEVVDLIAKHPQLRLTGVHCHLGSQITSAANLLAALDPVLAWTARLRETAALTTLNIGGGFGVPGIHRVKGAVAGLSQVQAATVTEAAPIFELDAFGLGLRDALAAHRLADLTVYAEPGRALVSAAVTLLTRVAGVKRVGGTAWVLLDGGLNLLPTAGVAERHRIAAVGPIEGELENVLVGGPLCYEGDVFGLDVPLPSGIAVGDYVTVHDAGAYGLTRATSFNRLRAAAVAVSGDQAELVWRREDYTDVMRFAVGGTSR